MSDEIYSAEPNPTPSPIPAEPVVEKIAPKRSSFMSLLFGLLLVLLVAGLLGTGYYVLKIRSELGATPAPSPSLSPSPLPSLVPSLLPSASPVATKKPEVSVKKIITPTATPTPLTNFDIRFGNPSANVKQTYDDGSGVGRVINREYTSIQAGQFDEVPSSWNSKVTLCFHVVTNEEIPGKNIKFSFSLDDKIEVEDTLSQYDKLEPGRLYDWCHDVTTNIGKHTAKMLLNGDKSVKEGNYVNDLGRIDYENLADNVAPNYVVTGPNHEGTNTCVALQYLSDNVTSVANLKIERKLDTGNWETTTNTSSCTSGVAGSEHTYAFRVSDASGNSNQQSKTFVLY